MDCRGLCLFVVAIVSLVAAGANADPCTLVNQADLATLLGPGAAGKASQGNICAYTEHDAKASSYPKTVVAQLVPALPDAAIPMMRKKIDGDSKTVVKTTDEAGLGDKAFSTINKSGAMVFAFKNGKTLQLIYLSGKAGTQAELDTLRSIAHKAYSAL